MTDDKKKQEKPAKKPGNRFIWESGDIIFVDPKVQKQYEALNKQDEKKLDK